MTRTTTATPCTTFSKALNLDGVAAARDRDSGGPVFTLDGAGVRAKGISSAVRASVPNGPGVDLLFQDMNDIVDRNLLFPMTG